MSIAEVWLLPMEADPSAVLASDGLLYVTVPKMSRIVALDQRGQVRGEVPANDPIVCAASDRARRRLYLTAPTRPGFYPLTLGALELPPMVQMPHAYLWLTVAQQFAYANCATEPKVDVIDLDTLQVTAEIPVSGRPLRSVLVRDRLYVTSGEMMCDTPNGQPSAKVDIVDISRNQVERTIALPGAYPMALAADDGRFVYIASNEQGTLVRLDTSLGELDPSFHVVTAGRPYDMLIDPRRGLAFLSCQRVEGHLSVVSLHKRKEIARVWAGEGFMAADRDRDQKIRRLFIPNVNAHAIVVIDPEKLVTSP